jgi:hypothetical protein
MASSAAIINEFIERARRRLLRMELGAGMLAGMSFCLGLVVGVTVLTWVFGPLAIVRMLAAFLLPFGLLTVVFLYWVWPRLRWRYPITVARRIEHEFLGDRLELISALQLQQTDDPAWSRMYSQEFVAAHLDRVAQLLREQDPRRLVPRARLRNPLIGLAALVALALLLGLFRPDTYGQAYRLLVASPASVANIKDEIAELPAWLGDIRLTYRYPAYAGRENRTVTGSDGSIVALPGTEVAVSARADRPIARGHLNVNGEETALSIESERLLTGRLLIQKAGAYRFVLTDQHNEVLEESRGHSIQLETDRPPEVILQSPAQDQVVHERDTIPLTVEARDDFGLQELRLLYRVLDRDTAAGENEQHRVLRRFDPSVRRITRERFHFDLRPLGLAPGEHVQLYIEASDNDNVLGPKVGRSATRTLKVFSAEQEHRELLTRLIKIWEQLIALLADDLEALPHSSTAASEETVDARMDVRVANNLSAWLTQVTSLTAALRDDTLAFKPLIAALTNIQRGLRAAQRQLDKALQQSPSQVRLIENLRRERIEQLERDVLYLEDFLDQVRLDDLQRIASDLMAAEERLHTILSDYSRAPSDAARQTIEAEIARLKARMAQLLARQAEVVKGVRDEYLNPEALSKHLQEKDVLGTLDRMRQLLNEGKLSEALGELERLRHQVQNLRQALDQSRATYGQGKYAELIREVTRFQSELDQILGRQRRLSGQTQVYRQQVLQQMQQRGETRLKQIFEQLRERLKNVLAQLEGIEPAPLEHFWGADRVSAIEHAHNLDNLLHALDWAGALGEAEGLAMTSKSLAHALASLADYGGRRDAAREAHRQRAAAAARDAGAIYDRLRKLLPEPGQLLDAAARNAVRKLAEEQAELRERVRSLHGQMKRTNQQAPLFGAEVMDGVERCHAAMEEAVSKLSRPDPASAYPAQRSAIAELERLQKSVQSSQHAQSGGMPLPLGSLASGESAEGVGSDEINREPVEIPGPDDFQPSHAYRKELLEGMKDPVPQDFREQVRRYYEELVK